MIACMCFLINILLQQYYCGCFNSEEHLNVVEVVLF